MSAAAPYWEIVRTTAGFHARFRARNGRTIVSTEVYKKRDGALNAVLVMQCYGGSADVRDVDKRPKSAKAVIEPPIWLTSDMDGRDYWHDQEIHYRNCYGNECDQVDPPVGTLVQVRFGRVAFKDERP